MTAEITEVDCGTRLLYQQKKNIRLICITALWKNTELWKQLSLGGGTFYFYVELLFI